MVHLKVPAKLIKKISAHAETPFQHSVVVYRVFDKVIFHQTFVAGNSIAQDDCPLAALTSVGLWLV
jgi:hypothetical protein